VHATVGAASRRAVHEIEARSGRRPGAAFARTDLLPRHPRLDRQDLDVLEHERIGGRLQRLDPVREQECAVDLAGEPADVPGASGDHEARLGLERAHEFVRLQLERTVGAAAQ